MTYFIGNPGPGLGQEQKHGRIKPVSGIPRLPFLIIGFPTAIQSMGPLPDKKTKFYLYVTVEFVYNEQACNEIRLIAK